MTPYEIGIMLHYYTSNTDYAGRGEPILPDTLNWFEGEGLLSFEGGENGPRYKITDKGRFYCDGLTNLPLPTQRWEFKWPAYVGKADA